MKIDQFLTTWEKLGPGEQTLVLVYMSRLYAGQKKYGLIDTDKKDWTYEALEEALDAAVYMSAALQQKYQKALDGLVEAKEREVIGLSENPENPDTEREWALKGPIYP